MAWGWKLRRTRVRLCRRSSAADGSICAARRVAGSGWIVRASVKDANVSDAAALIKTLQGLVRRVGCRGWVRLALPDPVFILRTLATDELPEDRVAARRFLAWQARDLLPFSAEHARLDFVPAGMGHDGRSRLTCLISNDRVLAEYERILHAVGLLPAVVDARSVALAQAASALLAFPSVGLLTADGGARRSSCCTRAVPGCGASWPPTTVRAGMAFGSFARSPTRSSIFRRRKSSVRCSTFLSTEWAPVRRRLPRV